MTIRCKYKCTSVTKTANWDTTKPPIYSAKFSAVISGSEENKKFFEATPSGYFEVGTYKEDNFEVGKEYYFDITLAE